MKYKSYLDAKRNTTEIPDRNRSHEKTTKKFDVLVEIIFVIGERFMGVFQYGHFPHYNWKLNNLSNIEKYNWQGLSHLFFKVFPNDFLINIMLHSNLMTMSRILRLTSVNFFQIFCWTSGQHLSTREEKLSPTPKTSL